MTNDELAPPNQRLDGYFDDLARLARLAEVDAGVLGREEAGRIGPRAHERALLSPLGSVPDATPIGAASPATIRAPGGWRRVWLGIGAALVALVLVLAQPWSGGPARDDGWLAKSGHKFALGIVVERDGAPVKIRSGDPVHTGERFGLFLDAPRRGYGAVWFVEVTAPPTRLFPRTGAGKLNAGVGIALPDGGAFTPTDQACEWVVGVLAAEPIDHDAVVAALRSAEPGADCALTFAAPSGVDSVTLALRRGRSSR